MYKLLARLFLIFFLSAASSLTAQAFHYENLVIEKIDIAPVNLPSNATFNERNVRSHMKTTAGDVFSQAVFDNDLKALAKDYDRIEPYIDVVNNKLFITIRIWFKPHIRTIQWQGNKAYANTDLQKELGIAPGSVFDRLAFSRAFNKMKAFYVKKGYFEAELDYEIQYDEVTNDVDIIIEIHEGRCGKIKQINYNNFCPEEIEDIEEMMVTKKYNFFMSWLTDEGIYNSEAIQHDEFTILSTCKMRGLPTPKSKSK